MFAFAFVCFLDFVDCCLVSLLCWFCLVTCCLRLVCLASFSGGEFVDLVLIGVWFVLRSVVVCACCCLLYGCICCLRVCFVLRLRIVWLGFVRLVFVVCYLVCLTFLFVVAYEFSIFCCWFDLCFVSGVCRFCFLFCGLVCVLALL